jgi:hypothetical protein
MDPEKGAPLQVERAASQLGQSLTERGIVTTCDILDGEPFALADGEVV